MGSSSLSSGTILRMFQPFLNSMPTPDLGGTLDPPCWRAKWLTPNAVPALVSCNRLHAALSTLSTLSSFGEPGFFRRGRGGRTVLHGKTGRRRGRGYAPFVCTGWTRSA